VDLNRVADMKLFNALTISFIVSISSAYASFDSFDINVKSLVFSQPILSNSEISVFASLSKGCKAACDSENVWRRRLENYFKINLGLLLEHSAKARLIYEGKYILGTDPICFKVEPSKLLVLSTNGGSRTLLSYLIMFPEPIGMHVGWDVGSRALNIYRIGFPEEPDKPVPDRGCCTDLTDTLMLASERLGCVYGIMKYMHFQHDQKKLTMHLNDGEGVYSIEKSWDVLDKYIKMGSKFAKIHKKELRIKSDEDINS
jgi:hypothetical protein